MKIPTDLIRQIIIGWQQLCVLYNAKRNINWAHAVFGGLLGDRIYYF